MIFIAIIPEIQCVILIVIKFNGLWGFMNVVKSFQV